MVLFSLTVLFHLYHQLIIIIIIFLFNRIIFIKQFVVFMSSKTMERAGRRLLQDVVVFRRGGTTSCRLEEDQDYVLVRS